MVSLTQIQEAPPKSLILLVGPPGAAKSTFCEQAILQSLSVDRYGMALRVGGAKAGKKVGERLTDAGLSEDDAVKRVLNLLEHCKVGKVTAGETIRMKENCEPLRTKLFATKREEPCCFFTTGFLNGFFSAVRNRHVKETKCIVLGDPYCEWEFR